MRTGWHGCWGRAARGSSGAGRPLPPAHCAAPTHCACDSGCPVLAARPGLGDPRQEGDISLTEKPGGWNVSTWQPCGSRDTSTEPRAALGGAVTGHAELRDWGGGRLEASGRSHSRTFLSPVRRQGSALCFLSHGHRCRPGLLAPCCMPTRTVTRVHLGDHAWGALARLLLSPTVTAVSHPAGPQVIGKASCPCSPRNEKWPQDSDSWGSLQ
ncbi:uncharacterized protein LOC132533811 [Erinaceus europaeus]|uniref:Uncharacterized protein LOC132533811 n=1 Tax=Erinaceus europaeus TaxID=9365 RepID=A0ABM3W5M1_ERIEU|nr:uncharacterized protein LOC132533811 [Erinaceus europaeus]